MNDITQLIQAVERGDANASETLLPLVYEELRRLARFQLAGERAGQTLQATALVHEAYLKLIHREDQSWESRKHFFRTAAEAMRRILIDQARRKLAAKHGGGLERLDIDQMELPDHVREDRLLAIDEALGMFEKTDPAKANLVKLRFFAGLTIEEAARALEVSIPTANRWWTFAKAWLYRSISEQEQTPSADSLGIDADKASSDS